MSLQATIDFRLKVAADPASPPTGWALGTGSLASKYVNRGEIGWEATAVQSLWYNTTAMQGNIIESEVTAGLAISVSIGAAIVDASGNGYMAINSSSASSLRIFLVVASQLSGSALLTVNLPMVIGQRIMLRRTIVPNNTYEILIDGVSQGSYNAPATYNPTYGAVVSRFGSVRQVDLYYTPNQTVTSINGGSPFTASQTTSSAVTTGFTGLPSTITSNLSGLTFSGIGGSTNAPTFSKSVPIDGAVYPQRGLTATVTFTNGSETASGAIDIDADADQTTVVVASPINDDITCLFGAIFAATGRSAANGDEVYHTVPAGMSDLVINPDGTMEVTNAGTFDCWVWTAATGVNYYYSVTITESGGVVIPPTTRPLGGRPIRSSLGRQIWPITPHATNPVGGVGETKKAYGIKVSGAGTVVIRTEGGDEDVTITLAAGATLPVVVTHVRNTSTATGILGYSIY